MGLNKKTAWELLLISFISLFLELAIIRWLSSEVRIFAYFKNLPLMAAFLGFGIGFFLYKKSDIVFPWFPRLACFLIIIIAWANYLGITHVIFIDPRQYFLLGAGLGDHDLRSVPSLLRTLKAIFVIVSLFFLTMATFAALTSKIGELLNKEKPLAGYSINVAGSLLGIIGFSLVSYLEWPPVIWLILVFLPLLYFYKNHIKLGAIYFILTITITFIANVMNPAIWSPYYRISFNKTYQDPVNIVLWVNYDGFQSIRDLSLRNIKRLPEEIQKIYSSHYNIPYSLARKKIDSVLILGGGTGNDAAAALRNGASRVDVVEIDPVIARIGRELHPEKPYSSEKVHLYIDDARSFLQKTKQKYDLVVFATLDSHTVFSSLSSLRLDNFVFTKESLLSARNTLNPGGGIVINFFVTKKWLFLRHFNTLKETMGKEPLVYGSQGRQEAIILSGDIFDSSRNPGITSYVPMEPPSSPLRVETTSDDWPFLFLEKRGIPFHYLLPLFIIFILSFIPLRISRIKIRDINWHLFFMGAAFLLIETKAVTTLALIFGSTWMVNSIVFSSVLIMILFANLLIERLSFLSFTNLYLVLFATLLFNYFFSFDTLNQFDWNIRMLSGGFIIGLPLFFAALIFAKAFAVVESPSFALASNLFGALVGGLLEYLDMWTGLRFLNLIALFLYGLSFLFLYAKMKRSISMSIDTKP
jgi:SAM-dependent methyltransferase